MSANTPKVIELYGYGQQHEATADASILPGMLVQRSATGVVAHAGAGLAANSHFANEYGLTGGTIDDEYEAGDQVIFTTYCPGAGVYALINTGVNAANGAFLSSAGNGTLRVAVEGDQIIAQAVEALNNTSGAPARLRVEVFNSATAPA